MKYTIDAANLENLTARVAKIARKATRLGCAAITLAVIAAYVVRRTFTNAEGETFTRSIPVVDVELLGEAPTVPGFALLATIEHTPAGNILRQVPTEGLAEWNLAAYREVAANCDHCNVARRRNDTFLVHELETGDVKQIGRTCLKDYMGGVDPHAMVALADAFTECMVAVDGDREFDYGANGPAGSDLAEFLVYVAASIRLNGWTSRGNARRYDTVATADDAMGALWDWTGKHPNGKPTAADVDVARNALTFVTEELEGLGSKRNDYQHNLWVIIQGGVVESKHGGFAASIVSYHTRAVERFVQDRLQAAKAADSEHVGTPKQRLTFRATVERKSWFEGRYGVTHIYKFRDSKGNALTWFASRDQELTVGDVVALTGTVKKHDDYKGEAQTVLTRCKHAPVS
jgi:hypothetical protein